MSATHAISKIEQKSQNRIPRELDQKFGIPRIATIYWVGSTFFGNKNRSQKKVRAILNPGIQPRYKPFSLIFPTDFSTDKGLNESNLSLNYNDIRFIN